MPRYLVVAHQTATSQALSEAVQSVAHEEPMAAFVLLVPATHVTHLLTWTEGESRALAQRAGDAAHDLLTAAGVRVSAVHVGDPSPLQAIDDELRDDPDYDALIISMLPSLTSRWLGMDVFNEAERRFGKRVIRVTTELTHAPG